MPVELPAPPDWRVGWDQLDARFDWIRAMKGCPQDPIHHAEGDVWTHVHMVAQALVEQSDFRELDEEEREILFWAVLLHDVAKPACTVEEEGGRISSRGHSRKGAILGRRLLWQLDMPFEKREEILALVLYHQVPFWILEREDPIRLARRLSLSCRPRLLALLAQADALGRHCADQKSMLERVQLFLELCREAECLEEPARFASEHGRFLYFQERWHDPNSAPHEEFSCTVTLMSGLPGAGKDTWIAEHEPHLPVVSLDQIRDELGARSSGEQGRVIGLARERAKEHLRAGHDFIWNATNLSKRLRSQPLELFDSYKARLRIVYVEAPFKTQRRQNRQRQAAVPARGLERMLANWELPTPEEAHQVVYHDLGEIPHEDTRPSGR